MTNYFNSGHFLKDKKFTYNKIIFLFLVTRHLNYPSYQFNVLRLITFSRKFNVYFALSKEYALKVSDIQSTLEVPLLSYTVYLCGCSISEKDNKCHRGRKVFANLSYNPPVYSTSKQSGPQNRRKRSCCIFS